MADSIDVVILTRDDGPLDFEVQRAVERQLGVRLHLHRIVGKVLASDSNRWETIARARNQGKQQGSAPWLFYLDDDVVLAPNCIANLLAELKRRPLLGAIAADYLSESSRSKRTGHVGMGATLFRRGTLNRINFRWEADRCECQCCSDDLRHQGIGITYSRAARAIHRQSSTTPSHHPAHAPLQLDSDDSLNPTTEPPVVMAAFDHHHYRKFRDRFMTSLRAAGNNELVCIAGYGLYPSQQRELARLTNVDLYAHPSKAGLSPARRRVYDFQQIVSRFDERTPVAYWDAADVIFQSRLSSLWQLVQTEPDRLLVVQEVISIRPGMSSYNWLQTICDPDSRNHLLRITAGRPSINSGFAAATARTMQQYLHSAQQIWNSPALAGSSDWGDQTALTLYCLSNDTLWRAIDESWNYCLLGRDMSRIYVTSQGAISCKDSEIHVVHGNGGTLPGVRGFANLATSLRERRQRLLAPQAAFLLGSTKSALGTAR